jgi:hypothetical protein
MTGRQTVHGHTLLPLSASFGAWVGLGICDLLPIAGPAYALDRDVYFVIWPERFNESAA